MINIRIPKGLQETVYSCMKPMDSSNFHFGDWVIPSDRSYCYLVITLTLSGSLSRIMNELRKKGLRAYFSLKNLVDISELTVNTLFQLFGTGGFSRMSGMAPKQLDDTPSSIQKIEDQPTYIASKRFHQIPSKKYIFNSLNGHWVYIRGLRTLFAWGTPGEHHSFKNS